jgi:hypothetical protein
MNITNNISNNTDTSRTCHIILLDGRKLNFLVQVFHYFLALKEVFPLKTVFFFSKN